MKTISMSRNNWTHYEKYKEEWTDEDFHVHLGDTIDMIYDPAKNIQYHQMESLGGIRLYDKYDEDMPLDFQIWSDDCIIFKNDEMGKRIYKLFVENEYKNFSKIVYDEQVRPYRIPNNIVRMRVPPDETATPIWGKEEIID